VNAVAPSVPEGFHLLRLTGDMSCVAVFNIVTCRAPLKVAVKLDTVWRVDVDALYFAAQTLALGERRHDLQRVTEYHAVGPVLVVLVKVGPIHAFRNAVEVCEQIDLRAELLRACLFRLSEQVVDKYLGLYFFLDIERRCVDNEIAPVLLILAAPNKLRVEIGVARTFYRLGLVLLFPKNGLVLGCGDILALGVFVLKRLDSFCGCLLRGFFCHD
jgi:hypothetical protein